MAVESSSFLLRTYVPISGDANASMKKRDLLAVTSTVRKSRTAMALLVVTIFSAVGIAHGQKVYSIGSVNTAHQFINAFEGFRSRMAELGYREDWNVRYQYYNSRGNAELLRTVTQKLVQDKVDLIVTSSTTGTVATIKATEGTRIPVVFLSSGNAQKLVNGFAPSGTNLAGISSASLELMGKRFEVLKELAPRTKKIAVPLDTKGVNYTANLLEITEAASRLGLVIAEVPIRSVDELGKSASGINRKTYDAVLSPADTVVTEGIEILITQAIKEKLPLLTSLLVNVKRGCLATYAADYAALGGQGAVLADKILRGAKPGDLPIELPHKINLALNLTTAKAIGLTIPKKVLLKADVVFE